MKVVGFNYTRMSAERALKWEPLNKINANLTFTDMAKDAIEGSKDQSFVRVNFKYEISYEPKNAKIVLEGLVLLSDEESKLKELVKNWSKKKELPQEVRELLFNHIWRKSNIKAFQLEDELNLIPHIQLPQVQFKKED